MKYKGSHPETTEESDSWITQKEGDHHKYCGDLKYDMNERETYTFVI